MVQQRDERFFDDLGESDAVAAREDQKVEIKVRRVAMVVTRLFEINAVGFDVHRNLFDQNLAPEFLLALCFFKLGKQCAEIKKTESLAGEVCVWTEVSR